MKFVLCLSLLLGFIATNPPSGIQVTGEIKELSVSPDGSVWLASNAGFIYRTANLTDDFQTKVKLPEPKPDYFGNKSIQIERLNFFNKDTFFVSGYLGDDLIGKDKGKTNKIYFTANGGSTWEVVQFSQEGAWIYDCYSAADGNAWMGGSDGKLFHTSDFGRSWTVLSSPFNESSRLAAIFANGTNGIAGALGNELKVSEDNFQTFKKIKTPYDQKAYKTQESKLGEMENRFYSVCILSNQYIVDQHNHVFFSGMDEIKWKKFTPELKKFVTNPADNGLFGLTEENEIAIFSKDFILTKILFKFPEAENVLDLKVVNRKLFVLNAIYAPPKEGDDVIGTAGKMHIARVGYKKVASYKIYKFSDEAVASIELQVTN